MGEKVMFEAKRWSSQRVARFIQKWNDWVEEGDLVDVEVRKINQHRTRIVVITKPIQVKK